MPSRSKDGAKDRRSHLWSRIWDLKVAFASIWHKICQYDAFLQYGVGLSLSNNS